MKRNTKQKELILAEVSNSNSFFNAEELHNVISKKYPKIGLATVYRALNDLAKTGEIHPYQCNRKTMYSSGKKNHCHFTCERCGEVRHLDIKKIDFLKLNTEGRVCHFQIDVTGVCKKCLMK